jgi:hypothetical protein
MTWDSNGYIDCRTRLVAALKDWPDLRVVEETPEIVKIGERHFIQATVTLFRTIDDALPVRAYNFEPFPGKTNFTRDSEQQNSATSALARALGYMGYGIERSIASFDEVRNRQPDENPQPMTSKPIMTGPQMRVVASKPEVPHQGTGKSSVASEAQINFIEALAKKSTESIAGIDLQQLSVASANLLITKLKKGIQE